ncbi:O-antigen ligase family protein [Salibacter sp.]|uniref:O-antigen ligase family protein n=1 Tax=Salibacter sp. TaxID=2010995 RepID=UPI00286FBD74|nr:O-antigen ligase family protein [Salibacter sp.]MDR9487989.1 O-antigen ligase family protein [Salibacter sp.]
MNGVAKIFQWLFPAVFLFPLLPLNVSSILFILTFIAALYISISKKEFTFKNHVLYIPLMLIGLYYLISFLFSSNSSAGWYEFERRAILLAGPILFMMRPGINFKTIRRASLIFIISSIVLSLVFVYLHIQHFIREGTSHEAYFFTLRTSFEQITNVHPTYFSLFSGASVILLTRDLLSRDLTSSMKWGNVFSLFILSAGIVFSGARTSIVATFLSVIILFLLKKRYKYFLFAGLLILPLVYFGRDVLFTRFVNFYDVLSGQMSIGTMGTSDRLTIFQCSLELCKQHWIFGLGPLNIQSALNGCYSIANPALAIKHTYNTHNEYMNQLLSFGLLGLISLGAFIFFLLKNPKRLTLVFSLGVLFGLQFLTENLLSRQHGLFTVCLVLGVFNRIDRSPEFKLWAFGLK